MTTTIEGAEGTRRAHARDVLLGIVLPLALGLLVLAALTALVALQRSEPRIAVAANVVVSLLIICPLALCMLPLSIGLTTLAVISGRAHSAAKKPLRRGADLAAKANDQARVWSDRIARGSIRINASTAPLEKWMNRLLNSSKPPQGE